jgi:putative membrane protein
MHDIAVIAAHGPASPEDLWGSWTLEPATLVLLAVAAIAYGTGAQRIASRRTAPTGRTPPGRPSAGPVTRSSSTPARRGARTASRRRVAAFYAGLAVVAVALLSPVGALGEALFSVHMVQHLLLVLAAPPLLVYGSPLVPALLGVPLGVRRALRRLQGLGVLIPVRRALESPIAVGAAHALAMWSWHLPKLYEAGLASPLWHAAEHATFLWTALLFWSLVLGGASRRLLPHGAAILLVFATALQSAALGAVLTFATRPLYPAHFRWAGIWGVDPLTDQQLAGLVMWVPAGAVYLVTMAALFLAWLRDVERRTPAGVVASGDRP